MLSYAIRKDIASVRAAKHLKPLRNVCGHWQATNSLARQEREGE